MTKLMSILTAGALALSLSGMAFAADDKMQDPTGSPADQAKQEQQQEYLAALKKCDTLQGAPREKCIDQANKKYNRM
jgi:hypothetical protein